jgi:hypothetical protein
MSTESIQPSFIRLPPNGTRCPYVHLTRSALDAITRPQESNGFNPPVKSHILQQSGTRRGVRLIDYPDLVRYLNTLSNSGKEAK